MGIQQMNTVLKFNRQQRSERKRLHELDLSTTNGGYGEFEDHTQMDLLAYAEFQKEQFAKLKVQRKRNVWMWIVISVLTFLILWAFLTFWKNAGFDYLFTSSFW
ncbi:MAG: hypothetical protein Aureis2KO_14550 [Aureisphaera sp.]